MDLLDTFRISGSGLVAERVRLQAVAANLANARTTRTAEGGPYQRRWPIFEAAPLETFGDRLDRELSMVEVRDIGVANAQVRRVYEPGHADADADGYVTYPDINVLHEMVDMMTSSRSYEANVNVLQTTRDLALRALEIGR
jgi:flagellar basal-body rod protein FlgC